MKLVRRAQPEAPATSAAGDAALLSVRDLHVRFPTEQGWLQAVDGVSFDLAEDEVLGIVGESGSGKTVTALSILGLLPATAQVSGQVSFRGRQLIGLKEDEARKLRGEKIAIVFQDALAALNPLHRVGRQVVEAIQIHHPEVKNRAARARVTELFRQVGMTNPEARFDQYPHEFSGGMRQRAVIAMAMANDPDVLIADEPTTALDVTTQAQVLQLLKQARERTRSAMILITHDLGVVAGAADRVMVMYAGRMVETGSVDDVFLRSAHPYTQGLLASRPQLDQEGRRLPRIPGQPPSLVNVPSGCPFHPRCPYAKVPSPCADEEPGLLSVQDGSEHRARCHFALEVAGRDPSRQPEAFTP